MKYLFIILFFAFCYGQEKNRKTELENEFKKLQSEQMQLKSNIYDATKLIELSEKKIKENEAKLIEIQKEYQSIPTKKDEKKEEKK